MSAKLRIALSLVAVSLFASCSPSSPDTSPNFTMQDALGNYDVTLDQNLEFTAKYSNAAAATSTVTYAELGETFTISAFDVSYDSTANVFTISITQNGAPQTLTLDGSAVQAYDENSAPIAFSPTAEHLSKVVLTSQIYGRSVTNQSTGCEEDSFGSLFVTITPTGIDAYVTQDSQFVTIGAGGSSPYVDCQAWLATAADAIRNNTGDPAGLRALVINGNLNINTLQYLTDASLQAHLSGAKVGATGARTMKIPSGALLKARIQQ